MKFEEPNSMIFTGQYTATTNKSFVIFLVGIRINNLWALHKWIPFVTRLFLLRKHLKKNNHSSLLNTKTWYSRREIMLVQYWHSLESLETFAHSEMEPHLVSWREYNTKIGKSADIGVWHETYFVDKRNFESIYNNMPRSGLALATNHCSISDIMDRGSLKILRTNTSKR